MIVRHPNRSAGFTLVETMVVLVLTGIVAAGLYQMLYAGRKSHDIQRHQIDMQQNARVAIGSLADDFRHVSYGKDPTQPSIRYAGPDSIVFAADIMPDVPGAEMIAYYLDPDGDGDTPNPDDTLLMKSVADSGGNVLFNSPQSYGIASGGLSLRYFNGGGTELPNPVPQPEMVGEVQVEVTATEGERWKQQPYSTMTLSATIYPRNLPLSPARSRPSIPACGDPTYPNCSAVTLTWEIPTTNTDGTELPLSDISHFNLYFGSDPNNLSLYARLARTFTEWTVADLGCDTYTLALTCVSRSGVESYQCRREVAVTGTNTPKAPASLATSDSSGVRVDWPPVTEYEDDTAITVPIQYSVHRSEMSGFAPDDANEIALVASGVTQYYDPLGNDCGVYYYKVVALACCQSGDPSPEAEAYRPSMPQCPTNLAGVSGSTQGSMNVSWSHPTAREDLTFLDPNDILETWVYYDTIPGSVANHEVVPAPATTVTLTGLTGCKVYYIHAKTRDVCGHLTSNSCFGNETTVPLSDPCDPAVPIAPASLAVSGEDVIELTWPKNTVDCDLAGYRIYYGYSAGNYSGTGAAEGDSPIDVSLADATQGDNCAAQLSGLAECSTLYTRVAAVDRCEPPHVSPQSPEAYILTTCTPCLMAGSCVGWVSAYSAAYKDAHLEVYTEGTSDETFAKILPTWTGPARVLQVLYGRPLTQIWNSDGTAGQDGNVGPQASGSLLNVTDFVVPSWTDVEDGMPLALVFDVDVRDVPIDLEFRNPIGGSCTLQGTTRGAAVLDDFDDGNITGWTVRSGTWASSSGELYQSNATSNRMLIGTDIFTDLTMETKIKIVSGTTAYIVFRYSDDNNLYLAGIRSDADVVRIGRYKTGVFTQTKTATVTIDPNQWYNLKVSVTGSTVNVWLDCALVITHTDTQMNASGKAGFRTATTTARWDDVRCRNVAELP